MGIRAKLIDDALMREMLDWIEINLVTGVVRWKRQRGRCRIGDEVGGIDEGYRQFRFKGRLYRTHRVLAAFSEWLCDRELSPDMDIDHIDQNKLNNRLENLRIVPHSMNMRNQKRHRHNTSGVAGVSMHNCGKWIAYCKIRYKQHYLGLFDCLDEAAKAVKAFRAENGFTDRHGEER